MFVCSVSTVVFNANPLLRYDGYYILADLTEIPNLRQKATTILSRKLGEWCLGLEHQEDPFLPQRRQVFFALYSIASAIYRWVVVFSILWFLYKFFQQYHLERIGEIIGVASLWGLVVMPLYQVGKFFYVPGRLDKVKKLRMYSTLAILTAVVLAVVLVPLPHNVISSLEIQPQGATPVYVDVPTGGQLVEVYVKAGDRVAAGDKLALLKNIDLEMEVAKLEGEQKERQTQLENLLREGLSDPQATSQVPEVRKALETIKRELDQKHADQDRLLLKAPAAGTVLPPPPTTEHEDPEGRLPDWSGTPLDPKNRGAYLKEGVMFCQIGDPHKLEAILVIDQRDVEDVKKDLDVYLDAYAKGTPESKLEGKKVKVDIKLDSLPHETLHSYITELANRELEITPHRLSTATGGDLPTTTDKGSGAERPQSTSYQARAPLDDLDNLLLLGMRGRGKIHAAWLPLGTRLWRLLTHTFNFKL
jgi:putative peptide zinc metalloprotease protein